MHFGLQCANSAGRRNQCYNLNLSPNAFNEIEARKICEILFYILHFCRLPQEILSVLFNIKSEKHVNVTSSYRDFALILSNQFFLPSRETLP